MSLIADSLSLRLVDAVEDKEPLEWIKKLVAFNPSCIGVAIPKILATTNPEPPSVEVIQVLAQLCPPDSVYSFLLALLKSSNPPPSLKLVRMLVEKNPAVLKQRGDQFEFYNYHLLHYYCLYQPDFEIIQFLVNAFPAACLQPAAENPNSSAQSNSPFGQQASPHAQLHALAQPNYSVGLTSPSGPPRFGQQASPHAQLSALAQPSFGQSRFLPWEILERRESTEKDMIDWMTKATIEIGCVFVEAKGFSEPEIGPFIQQIIGQENSSLNLKKLYSKLSVEGIGMIMRHTWYYSTSRTGDDSLHKPDFLQRMEQIHRVNKAKREFDEQTAVPFPVEPKTIITFD